MPFLAPDPQNAADASLQDADFVAFDLETTGLDPQESRVVEFGAVRFRLAGDRPEACFEQLVNPEGPIPSVASRVHGISTQMVRGMPTIREVLPRFVEFLGCASTILLAHNARFDRDFLASPARKLGLDLPPHRIVDTLDLAQRCLPGLYRYRLETLARYFRISDVEDHRALSDARLAMQLFRKLLQRNSRLRTVRQLLELSPPLLFFPSIEPGSAPQGFEDLERAIVEKCTVVMIYDGGTKGACERRITPRRLLQGGRPSLIAWCHVDQIEKTYRLDRIREFRLEDSGQPGA